MSPRELHTRQAAQRLIKSQARKYVYQTKLKQDGGTTFSRLLMLEEAIEEEAFLDWQKVLATWPQGFERFAVQAIIEKAAKQAHEDCIDHCEEIGTVARKALHEFFHGVFDPHGLLLQEEPGVPS